MFKVIAEQDSETKGKFIVEPLETGFGHTLGNSLRRVLLSALDGSAITSAKIDGVAHQFSVIKGVKEDVIEILLNLKKIRVKVFSDKPIRLKLSSSGKGDVKAKEIEVIGDGEIANPDAYIATLTDPKSKLEIEMSAEKGKGYSLADERRFGEIGVIPVDALFNPVIAINYTVEPTRVGRRIDLDKLTVDIETDGTITPRDALNQAATILADTFRQIFEPRVEEEEEQPSSVVSDEVLKMSVEEIDLPVRITNALKVIDVNTVADLLNAPKAQLLKAKNLGNKSVNLISEKLLERGLTLSEA